MKIDLPTLTDWLGGIRVLSGYEVEDIPPFQCRMYVDSRDMEPGGLFVCFKGENTDGHFYVRNAIQNGAQGIVTEHVVKVEQAGVFQIHVASTREALKKFANHVLCAIQPGTIGITGSAGKTTTKELVQAIFGQAFSTFGTLKNYNTPIGIPLSLAQMPWDAAYFIAEMSASCPGELEEILSFVCPSYGIITSIGASHLEFFKGVEGVYEEKIKLAKNINQKEYCWMNGDQDWAKKAISENIPLTSYGFLSSNDVYAENVRTENMGISFDVHSHGTQWKNFYIRGHGKHLVLNALPAIGIAINEGIAQETIRKALNNFSPGKGRGRCLKLKNQLLILDESYNANPLSMKTSLEALLNMPFSRKIVVLGDMLELGEKAWELHLELGKWISSHETEFEKIIYVGKYGEAVKEGDMHNRSRYHCEASWKEAFDLLVSIPLHETTILIKASNGVGLFKLVEALEEKYS